MHQIFFLITVLWNHSFRVGHCLWIVKTLLVHGDGLSWVTGLLHYNSKPFITLLNVPWEVNKWVLKYTLEIHNIDDSIVTGCNLINCDNKIPQKVVFFPTLMSLR